MSEFWAVVAVLVAILAVFVAAAWRATKYYVEHRSTRHPKVRLSDSRASLKSGDIILFIGHAHGHTTSLFTGDLYSHAGMVVGMEAGLGLSEVASASGRAGLEPLEERLEGYPGAVFLMALSRPLLPEQEAALRGRAAGRAPYPNLLQLVQSVFRPPAGERQARHCMQHVAWLLDGMGLTPARLRGRGETLLGAGVLAVSRAVTGLPGEPLGLGAGANAYGPIRELLRDGGLPRRGPPQAGEASSEAEAAACVPRAEDADASWTAAAAWQKMEARDLEALRAATAATTPRHAIAGRFVGKVLKTYDGDTCHVAFLAPAAPAAGRRIEYVPVRLLGYDAPEMRKTKGLDHRPYGEEVRAALRALVDGKLVVVEIPPTERPDPYGRSLGRLFAARAGPQAEKIGGSVRVRGRDIAVPATVDVPAGHPVDDAGLRALLDVNRWMLEHARVKPYAGKGARPTWTSEELREGI
jgi:endonuclease YncB( thermonuclease family)